MMFQTELLLHLNKKKKWGGTVWHLSVLWWPPQNSRGVCSLVTAPESDPAKGCDSSLMLHISTWGPEPGDAADTWAAIAPMDGWNWTLFILGLAAPAPLKIKFSLLIDWINPADGKHQKY